MHSESIGNIDMCVLGQNLQLTDTFLKIEIFKLTNFDYLHNFSEAERIFRKKSWIKTKISSSFFAFFYVKFEMGCFSFFFSEKQI